MKESPVSDRATPWTASSRSFRSFCGQDPLSIARHVRTLETISFHAGRYWPLEAALWDIIGQVCGQPVATLFGGARDRIPAYASCGEIKAPEERAEHALALRARGIPGAQDPHSARWHRPGHRDGARRA